jgi:5-oxoprolinase (ATP-hydrolysing)
LDIAFQTRPSLFQLAVKKVRYASCTRPCPVLNAQFDVLYSKVVEVDERIIPEWKEFVGSGELANIEEGRLIETPSGVVIRELKPVGKSCF